MSGMEASGAFRVNSSRCSKVSNFNIWVEIVKALPAALDVDPFLVECCSSLSVLVLSEAH